MKFLNPDILAYLFLLPVLLLFSVWRARVIRQKYLKHFRAKTYDVLADSVSKSRSRWKLILEILVMALLILTLARPQFGRRLEELKSEGLEIVLMMDVSPSMTVEDVKPSRLEMSKILAKKLIASLGGDRIGIVAVSGSAMMVSPLTPDRAALELYIDTLTVSSVSTIGTDFKKAFQEVIETFDPQDPKNPKSQVEESGATRVAILFSDGENHEQGVDQGLELLKSKGIQLFTVTVGTEKGGLIPERDPRGFLQGYKKNRAGQIVNSTARYAFMRDLAVRGGGSAVAGDLAGSSMKNLLNQLERLERGEFETEKRLLYDERFQLPLALALILALIELTLSVRRQSSAFWKGRFEKSV